VKSPLRDVLVSIGKICGFFLLWALLLAAVVMSTVGFAGVDWYRSIGWRLWTEIGGTIATLAAVALMARFVDKRALSTIGFPTDARVSGLLSGAMLGALIFSAPLAILLALGLARFNPDFAGFSGGALALGLMLCFFNVVTQEVLVRGYIFQELWTKYGAAVAIGVTTLIFVALHAAPILQGENGAIVALNIAIASVMLGLAYVRTGALWLPIGIHLGWNGLQGPVLGMSVTGQDIGLGVWRFFELEGPRTLTGGSAGVEGGWIGLIGPLLGLAIVALAVRPRGATPR
jgi:membrane protease YdiL (CAAX protease family)